MLTDRKIQRASVGMHADGGGLYLRVTPKGKKSWVRRTRTAGTDIWANIGGYPKMSLAEARRAVAGVETSVDALTAKNLYLSKLSVVRLNQVEWLLKELPPSLNISKRDIVAVLQTKAKTAPVMANRMLTRWHEFYGFCEQQGWISANPLDGVQRKFIGGKEKVRSRTLTSAEIAELVDPALRMIVATGLRPTEALWVLKHGRTTQIPNKRTPRDGYLHSLPRSRVVQYLLQQKIVLPASHLTLSNKLRRQGATYRPHDLRRTFATKLGELGVLPHVVEKMLGHKMQGVMAVYNHAEYWPERIAAQRKWDRFLIALWRKKYPRTCRG